MYTHMHVQTSTNSQNVHAYTYISVDPMVHQMAQEGALLYDKTWATLVQSKMGWYC